MKKLSRTQLPNLGKLSDISEYLLRQVVCVACVFALVQAVVGVFVLVQAVVDVFGVFL